MKRLTARHKTFVAEYLKDNNATQAWMRLGWSKKPDSAAACASRMLSNAKVKEAVEAAQNRVLANAGYTKEEWVRSLKRFTDVDLKKVAIEARDIHAALVTLGKAFGWLDNQAPPAPLEERHLVIEVVEKVTVPAPKVIEAKP